MINFVLIALIALASFFAVRAIVKSKRSGKCIGCSHCAEDGGCCPCGSKDAEKLKEKLSEVKI